MNILTTIQEFFTSIPHSTELPMWLYISLSIIMLISSVMVLCGAYKIPKLRKQLADMTEARDCVQTGYEYLQKITRTQNDEIKKLRTEIEKGIDNSMQVKALSERLKRATDENRRYAIKTAFDFLSPKTCDIISFEKCYKEIYRFLQGKETT